jgi:hypothetical protein
MAEFEEQRSENVKEDSVAVPFKLTRSVSGYSNLDTRRLYPQPPTHVNEIPEFKI